MEKIKERIWDLLQDRLASLAMIFNDRAEILWHRGRKITSPEKIQRHSGYCSTQIRAALSSKKASAERACLASYGDLRDQETALILNISSVAVIPAGERHFLYVDSGTAAEFSSEDLAVFQSLGSLLAAALPESAENDGQMAKMSGKSGQMNDIRKKMALYAPQAEPILLLGETGVGKNHLAKVLHDLSGRPGDFVPFNTPGVPAGLIETHLFGHARGAFTGAGKEFDGFIARAENGTIFLDEIAEIEPELQAKLLHFIDTKKYHRVGESRERRADVRIIAATNRDLEAMIAERGFRRDLYYRLNHLGITIPPLRERPEDIECLLAEHHELLKDKTLAPQALEILKMHAWPGNIRELKQVLKKAALDLEGPEIGPEIAALLPGGLSAGNRSDLEKAWQKLKNGESFWAAVKEPFLKRELNRDQVRELLARGLAASGGKYTLLTGLFNLDAKEYHALMRFLNANQLQPGRPD